MKALNADFVQFSSVTKAVANIEKETLIIVLLDFFVMLYALRRIGLMDSVSVHDDCIVVLCIKRA